MKKHDFEKKVAPRHRELLERHWSWLDLLEEHVKLVEAQAADGEEVPLD